MKGNRDRAGSAGAGGFAAEQMATWDAALQSFGDMLDAAPAALRGPVGVRGWDMMKSAPLRSIMCGDSVLDSSAPS